MNLHKEAKLNHLSFPTANVAETAAFFEKYLGCELVAAGQSCLLKRNGFDDVHTLYQEFLGGGVCMETQVFNNSRGSRFICRSPGGVLIEVNTRADMHEQGQWENCSRNGRL